MRKSRKRVVSQLVLRQMVNSSRIFGSTLCGMRKLQMSRARSILKDYLERDAMIQGFFTKSLHWLKKMKSVRDLMWQ